eukprot:scaffold243448_cov28-Tisochrysis_lutea.AAC.1
MMHNQTHVDALVCHRHTRLGCPQCLVCSLSAVQRLRTLCTAISPWLMPIKSVVMPLFDDLRRAKIGSALKPAPKPKVSQRVLSLGG